MEINVIKEIKKNIKNIEPFYELPNDDLNNLIKNSFCKKIEIGEQIIEFNKIPEFLPVLINGSLRLLVIDEYQNPITLKKVEDSQLIGWSTVLRGSSDISIIASSDSQILFIPTMQFISLINLDCIKKYILKSTVEEIYTLSNLKNYKRGILKSINKKRFLYWYNNLTLDAVQVDNHQVLDSGKYLVSSSNFKNFSIGEVLNSDDNIELKGKLPGRLIPFFDLPQNIFNELNKKEDENKNKLIIPPNTLKNDDEFLLQKEIEEREALQDLYGKQNVSNKFPHIKGEGEIDEKYVVIKMLARYFELPFRKDTILKILGHQSTSQNFKNFGLIEFSALFDMQGLSTTKLTIEIENLQRLPLPSLLQLENRIYIIWDIDKDGILLSDPTDSQSKLTFNEFKSLVTKDSIDLLSVKRTKNTPKKRFDLSWFVPYIIKHRRILIQVFLASFFVQLFQLFNPLLIQQIIDAVVSQGNVNSLNVYGTLLITFAIGEASLGFLRTYLFNDTTNRIDISLGTQIINHLFKLPLSYFSNRPTGEISNRINELSKIRTFLTSRALTLVLDTLFCFIYISVMLIYSVKLTLWAFVVLPIFILITLLISPMVKRQLREQAVASSKVQAHLVETLGNIETVKGQSMELFSRWKWQQLYGNQINSGFKNVITNGVASSLSTFFQQLSGLFVLLAGIKLVLQGELTLGQLIAFRIIAGYVTQPLLRLTTLWQSFQETFISLERIADVINTPQEIEIFGEDLPPLNTIKGNIEFRNVGFKFHEKSNYVLKNINLKIEAPSFTGIVGMSGSGKSTLFKLLTKTYDVNDGNIYIDGYDISKVDLYSLRTQIGYVPQDSVLFEGSIIENISITSPSASFEEIEKAAKIACADEFIQKLSGGYNSPVGEKGQNLSGGQRQRIAIARTLLRNPKLIILDESTSALDPDTEKLLINNLKNYANKMTLIFITHRLNAIIDADKIIVVDKGSISEIGTHQYLLKQQGRYFTLFTQQRSDK